MSGRRRGRHLGLLSALVSLLCWALTSPAGASGETGRAALRPGATLALVTLSGTLRDSAGSPANASMGGFWGLGFASITDDD
jgi:hypothetical protein